MQQLCLVFSRPSVRVEDIGILSPNGLQPMHSVDRAANLGPLKESLARHRKSAFGDYPWQTNAGSRMHPQTFVDDIVKVGDVL